MSKDAPHRPRFTECYRLGVAMSKHLEPVCTLEAVGAEFGITKQNAYTECALALGKLVWHLQRRLGVGPQ